MFTLTRKIFRINNTSDPSGAAIRPPQHRVPTLLVSLSMLLLLMAFPGYTQTYATAGVFDLEITTGGAMVITATGADGGNALNSGNTGWHGRQHPKHPSSISWERNPPQLEPQYFHRHYRYGRIPRHLPYDLKTGMKVIR